MDSLITKFCKVEFLCYAGEPNWLGWAILFIFGGALFLWFLYLLEGLEGVGNLSAKTWLLLLIGFGFLFLL